MGKEMTSKQLAELPAGADSPSPGQLFERSHLAASVVPPISGATLTVAGAGAFSAIAQTTTPSATPGVVHNLPATTAGAAFREAFASRVLWMVKDGVQTASVRLNPPDLGTVNIHIAVNHAEAVVSFAVHNDPARDAIEQALPQLKTLLEESGLSLGGAQVVN